MYALTKEQVEHIMKDVEQAEIHVSHLQHDLVDHLCCAVEEEIWEGHSFEESYRKVRRKIGLGDLKQIQKDTLYLIDFKYRIMKTIVKIMGVLSLIMLAMAALFKIMHWPGAGIIMVLGFAFLCFLFFPSLIFTLYRETKSPLRGLIHFTGFLGGTVFILSILFKIMHWPGANVMIMAGVGIINFLLIPSLAISYAKKGNKKLAILGGISGIIYVNGILFKMMHWPGASIQLVLGTILFTAVFIPLYVKRIHAQSGFVKADFIFIVVGLIYFNTFAILLALNVSSSFLNGYISADYHGQRINTSYSTVLAAWQKKIAPSGKFGDIREQSQALDNHIEELKMAIVSSFSDIPANKESDYLRYINPSARWQNENLQKQLLHEKGDDLRQKIDEYRTFLLSVSGKEDAGMLNKFLETDYPDRFASWQHYMFQHQSPLGVISTLTLMQNRLLMAEAQLLEYQGLRENNIVSDFKTVKP